MLRPAERKGTWYPSTAAACDRFLSSVALGETPLPDQRSASIVPHAGWVYSGAIAWEALRRLAERHPSPDLVLVFGGHLGARTPPRLQVEGGWETPFGPVPIASEVAQDVAMAIECELESAEEYTDDNGIEVVMPMVKRLWPDAPALTMGIPPTDRAVAIALDVLDLAQRRGFRDIAVIGSTDLTHYGPNYDFRPHGSGFAGLEWVKTRNDPEVIEKLAQLDAQKAVWTANRQHNACCIGAAAAAVACARKLGAERGVVTRYATSWDVRPSEPEPTSFVGYVGMVLGR